MTEDGGHPERAAREAADSGAEVVVVALGGDGHVSACANALIGTGVPLAIVPTGTGNDFPRRLGLDHRRPLRSFALIEHGSRRSVDAVRIEGAGWIRHYVCVAGAGFDSATNAVANTMRHLRCTARYLVALLRTLRTFTPAEFHVTTDDEELRLDAMMVAVANAASYGGGMRVCPDALVDDEASRPFDVYADGERFGPLPLNFAVELRTLEAVAP